MYRLKVFSSNTSNSGLFGSNNKFIRFLPEPKKDLVLGNGDDYSTIGPSTGDSIGSYKNKANCSELNKWICLSVHWNQPAGNNDSSVYCNGQKLGIFTTTAAAGSSRTAIRASNIYGRPPLNGDIALFILYRNKMEESDILLHHKCICEKWFNIDHEPISIV